MADRTRWLLTIQATYIEILPDDYIIILHGDDQGKIDDLLPHLENRKYEQYDSFLGSRFMKGSKLIGYSKFRIVANYLFNFFCSIVTKTWITDQGSGLNMYNVEYLRSKFYILFPNNLTFPNTMFFYGIYTKSRFAFFPIKWLEEDQVSNARIFRQGFEVLKIVLSLKRFYKKTGLLSSDTKYSYNIIYSSK